MEEYEKVIRERFENEETRYDKKFFLEQVTDLVKNLYLGLEWTQEDTELKECSCGAKTIRKFCPECNKEQDGDYFKCSCCGEKTLNGFESRGDTIICGICSREI